VPNGRYEYKFSINPIKTAKIKPRFMPQTKVTKTKNTIKIFRFSGGIMAEKMLWLTKTKINEAIR
jgi:hypothetical protein